MTLKLQLLSSTPLRSLIDEEDWEDDEVPQDDREIWEVTHASEEDLEKTEGEGVDLLDELLELVR